MQDEKLKYRLAFGRVSGIGKARFKLLESYFGRLDQAWTATGAEFQAVGRDKRTTLSITTRRSTLNPDEETERLNKIGVRVLTWNDSDYPARL
jgi:DNA processing protein